MSLDVQAEPNLSGKVDALGDEIDWLFTRQIILHACLIAAQTVLYAVLIARLGERIAS
jgi:hypothetical protein